MAELLAWDAPFIQIEQTAVSSVTYSNMSLNQYNIETMIGENSAFDNFMNCPEFSASAPGAYFEYDLPVGSTVYTIFFKGAYIHLDYYGDIGLVQPQVLSLVSNQWVDCTPIDFSNNVIQTYLVEYSTCGEEFVGVEAS